MKIAKQLTDLIGNTPLLELNRYSTHKGLSTRIIAKLESFNPLSSAKDRVGLALIEDAEKTGRLAPGGTIIEPTSGNTGVGLSYVAASRGYHVILTMPDTMSQERRSLLKALGAELVLTDGAKGMQGSIEKAEELAASIPGAFLPGQFTNPSNPRIHRETTAQEIWRDTDGKVDIFVAGIGTGGTITGVGEGLKAHNPNVLVAGVEPAASALLSGKPAGSHKLQGIGANFIPEILNREILDEIFDITDDEAFEACRLVAQLEGLLIGISSGAALAAATKLASRPENTGKLIVVLLPDTGERYLSTGLFD